jgi:hypothetical protein
VGGRGQADVRLSDGTGASVGDAELDPFRDLLVELEQRRLDGSQRSGDVRLQDHAQLGDASLADLLRKLGQLE